MNDADEVRVHHRERVEVLSACIAAFDRRERILAIVSDSRSVAEARTKVRSLLNVSEEAAEAVLCLQLLRFTKEHIEYMRNERDELARSLGTD